MTSTNAKNRSGAMPCGIGYLGVTNDCAARAAKAISALLWNFMNAIEPQ